MKATKAWDLVGLAVIAAVATWLMVRSFYGSVPPIGALAGASLYAVAVIELGFGFFVRSRIGGSRIGDGPRQLHPITVARTLALAKASALVGAVISGVWTGFLLHVLPLSSTVRAASHDRVGAWVGLVAGVALVGAALWLEHCCRTPSDRADDAT